MSASKYSPSFEVSINEHVYGAINIAVRDHILSEINTYIPQSYNDPEVESYNSYQYVQWSFKKRTNKTTKEIADLLEKKAAKQKAKWKAIKRRRADFEKVRAIRILELLNTGVDYICCHPGCSSMDDLTIDHKKPLSRGGNDEIENLQFMCRSHNSSKNDKEVEAE